MIPAPAGVLDAMTAAMVACMVPAGVTPPPEYAAALERNAREYAQAAWDALVGASEVREEWALRLTCRPGTKWAGEYQEHWDRDEEFVDGMVADNANWDNVAASKTHHLIITTPTETTEA